MGIERPKLPITLTGLEVVFLTDSIANDDVAQGLPEKDAYWPLAREALLLLGSAYKEVVSPSGIAAGPVTIYITEEIAWLLRSKVKTGDVAIDNKTNVGIPILLKLYDLLQSFNSGFVDFEATGEDPPVDKEKLVELRRQLSDARTDADPDKGT
jgi:hypothetical protein